MGGGGEDGKEENARGAHHAPPAHTTNTAMMNYSLIVSQRCLWCSSGAVLRSRSAVPRCLVGWTFSPVQQEQQRTATWFAAWPARTPADGGRRPRACDAAAAFSPRHALADMIQASLMLKYNERKIG